MSCKEDASAHVGDYVVAVFPGDHDQRTCAAGFRTEDGTGLAQAIHEPDVIDAVAERLTEIAHEIRAERARDNLVRGVDWGRPR